MSRREIVSMAALSLIWGASFMFIRVADRQVDPAALVFFRLVLACAVLVPAAFAGVGAGAFRLSRALWLRLCILGLVNTAAPFLLISWAETRIDSGLAAILQAAAPIFSVLIATRIGDERVGGHRLAGVLVGLAGVALLVGSPGGGGLLAALAVVLAALAYASGASFGSHMLGGTPPLVVGAASTSAAALLVAPLGLSRLPDVLPGWKALASIAALGLIGTGVAYIILFGLLRRIGPSRTILITYLIPGIAVLYGWLLLGESLRAVSLGGLALVLAGVTLAGRGGAAAATRPRAAAAPLPAPPPAPQARASRRPGGPGAGGPSAARR